MWKNSKTSMISPVDHIRRICIVSYCLTLFQRPRSNHFLFLFMYSSLRSFFNTSFSPAPFGQLRICRFHPLPMGKPPNFLPQKRLLGRALNCIWWWVSSSVKLEDVEYLLIPITLWSTLTWSSSTCQCLICCLNRSV